MTTKMQRARSSVESTDKSASARRVLRAGAKPAAVVLAGYFHRNGFVRKPDAAQVKFARSIGILDANRKGHEVRLIPKSAHELREMHNCLRQVGIGFGKPFAKGPGQVLPIYGKERHNAFMAIVKAVGASNKK